MVVCTSRAAEYVPRNGTILEVTAATQLDGRTEGTVEEIPRQIDGITVFEPKAALMVPFHTISRSGDGGNHGATQNARITVGAEPVVQDKGIPAVNIQTAAQIVVEHGVTEREAPDMLQMDSVARKPTDAAIINGGRILLSTAVILFPVQVDAVDVFAQPLAIQADPRHSTAERPRNIQEAGCLRIIEDQGRQTVLPVVPAAVALQAGTDPHFQPTRAVSSGRHQNRPLYARGIVQGTLDSRGAIGRTVTHCPVIRNIK